MNDRFLLLLGVLLFGMGITNAVQGGVGLAYFDFAVSGLCFAAYR